MATPTRGQGKYEFLSRIRQGGMGAIYLARHNRLDGLVVIKTMRPELADQEEYIQRFNREAKKTSELLHPNIARLYDFDETEQGMLYMVLEFIDGVNLKDLTEACGPPPVSLAIEIIRQSLAALGHLHRANMVHRDISPDNLMLAVDESGRPTVKLIDLGIARRTEVSETITQLGSFIGKPAYCSPEQLNFGTGPGDVDSRSDLFSMGIVLAEVLTGERVFPSAPPLVLVGMRSKPVPLDFERTDPRGRIWPSLRAVVMRSVAMDRNTRYQTAEEFSDALESALTDSRQPSEDWSTYLTSASKARPSLTFSPLSLADRTAIEELIGQRGTRTAPTQAPGDKEKTAIQRLSSWLTGWRKPKAGETILQAPIDIPGGETGPRKWPVPIAWTVACLVVVAVGTFLYWRGHRSVGKPDGTSSTVQTGVAPSPFPSATPAAPLRRLCMMQPGTTYGQKVVKERPTGFAPDEVGYRAPRTDSARVTVVFRCEPEAPLENQTFRLSARLKNDGDEDVELVKIEELGATDWRPIREFKPAQIVNVAGSFSVFENDLSVGQGKAFNKSIRIVEGSGDMWTAQVRITACD